MTRRALTGVLIPADETQRVEVVEACYDTLAKAIGCQWIEIVHHPWLTLQHMVLVVDEEGRLTSRPLNVRASRFHPQGLAGDVLIVGDAIVDGERDLVGLSPFQVAAIAGMDGLEAVVAP